MCKHEKTALLRGWYASGRSPAKLSFQRLFDCHLILIHWLGSKNLNVTFLHKRFTQISILALGYPPAAFVLPTFRPAPFHTPPSIKVL
jgi:hypothetical protein